MYFSRIGARGNHPLALTRLAHRLFHCTSLRMTTQKIKVATATEAPASGSMKSYAFSGQGDNAVNV